MPAACATPPPAGQHIQYTQEFLLNRLRDDETTFFGHGAERDTVRSLIERTVHFGESNSALIIGPARSGKSTVKPTKQHLTGQIGFDPLMQCMWITFCI